MLLALVPLQLLHGAAGQQLHLRVAAGEVQILAAIHDRRAGGAHVDLFRAALIQKFHRLPQLGAPDDGIVHEQQLFALDQLGHGDLLHLGHLVAHVLVGGHERTGPGGGVLHEGAGEGHVAGVGIADGVGQTRVGHTSHIVQVLGHAPGLVILGHALAVAIAHDLYVHALVIGVGVAVVGPEEGTDLHVLPRLGQGLPAVGSDLYDLTGAQLVGILIAQLVIGKGLEGDAAALVVFADEYGQTAQPVTGGNDLAPLGEDEQGEGALDHLLGVENAGDQVILLVDEGGGQLGGVHPAGAHGHELVAVVGEIGLDQLVGVVDDAHRGDGIQTKVGPHQQGLGVGVTDAADTGAAVKVGQVPLELGAEGGVFDVVDLALKAVLLIEHDHAAPAGAQVGVVVHSEENIKGDVPLRDGAKKTSHVLPPCCWLTCPSGGGPSPDRRPPRCPGPGGSGPCPASRRSWHPRSGRCRG